MAVRAGGGEPVPRPAARRDGDARVALLAARHLAAHPHCGRARARGAHVARARALPQYAFS